MLKIKNILNDDEEHDTEVGTLKHGNEKSKVSNDQTHNSTNYVKAENSFEKPNTSRTIVDGSSSPSFSSRPRNHTFPQEPSQVRQLAHQTFKINPKFLVGRNFVKLAIRRKAASQRTPNPEGTSNSKLHTKYLGARLTVNLTYVNNLTNMYNYILPYTSKKDIVSVFIDPIDDKEIMGTGDENGTISKNSIQTRQVQLIDNNLVNIAKYSKKILNSNPIHSERTESSLPPQSKSKKVSSTLSVPTFNSLDTAVHTFFGIRDYTLMRITRSTTDDVEGSVILKVETARPGDVSLVDEAEFSQEMLRSLGKVGSSPLNLFIKKIVARPRYKSNMKVFLLPNKLHFSLYTDQRMFERDLMNGIIDLQLSEEEINEIRSLDIDFKLPQPPMVRTIYVTFPYSCIIEEFKQLVRLTSQEEPSAAPNFHNNL